MPRLFFKIWISGQVFTPKYKFNNWFFPFYLSSKSFGELPKIVQSLAEKLFLKITVIK